MGELLRIYPGRLGGDDCRLLVESVQDYAICMLDSEGNVASWNSGAQRIKGYQAEEIIGRPFSTFYPPSEAPDEPARELEAVEKTGRLESEGWRVRKDGSLLWAHVVLTALRGPDGVLRGFASITRDLTAQRMAAESLTRSEERFRLLTDAVQDYAIYMLDLSGNVTTWNSGAERLKRYKTEEILGRNYARFFPPEDVAEGRPARELEIALTEGRFEEEGLRVRKDGTRFWANVVLTPIRGPGGKPIGFAKVTRDLSERRKVEEELRLSEQRFRLLVHSVADYAVYMLDPEGRITTWNAGAERIKGYREEEIVGRHFRCFFPPADVEAQRPEQELEIARTAGHFEQEGWRVRKDGSLFWANVVLTPMFDESRGLIGFAKVTRDLTSRRHAEETTRELIREQAARAAAEEAEARLRESERRYRALSQRLETILNGVSDGITVADRTGDLTFANEAAARMGGLRSFEELKLAVQRQGPTSYELFDEQGAPVPPSDLPGRRVLAGEPQSSQVLRVLDRAHGREYWCEVRASAVLNEAGEPELGVTIWHDVTAERRRKQHGDYLNRATAALAESLDYNATLNTLASLLVPGLADWCSIHLLEGEELHQVAVAHVDPERVRQARESGRAFPPQKGAPRGVWNVLRTGLPELYPHISDELLAQSAQSPEHLSLLRAAGMKSALIAPIVSRGKALGTLTLVSSEEGRHYGDAELSLVVELGQRAAMAIENASAYRAEKRARDQFELIARAGESFAEAQSYEEVLRRVVSITLPALGDFGFFDILEDDLVRRIASAPGDQELDALIKQTNWVRSERRDKNLCALSSGESGFHPSIDDAWLADVATSPEHLALLRRAQLCSMLTVPLKAQGRMVGSLTLCFGRSRRRHTQDDLRLAEELARRATIAVAQARLYASTQEARLRAEQAAENAEAAAKRAEEANRVKDEFLATVSHELRTPLNAILGWASLLLNRAEPSFARGVDVIHRNAQAQARIIDDILDVSAIVTGKLRLELKPSDLAAIITSALEVVRPAAEAKKIMLESLVSEEPCLLVADPERLQQVLWNLLANAVKFSDSGGVVRVALSRQGSGYSVTVSDTGRGIEPEFLPFVFERFRQGDASTTRRFGGLGLGLTIVRYLVELHGGHVEAASEGPGKGATFTVKLPVRAVAPPVEAAGSTGEDEAPRVQTPAQPLSGVRVLVVDDEPDARELLEALLMEAGAVVQTASSAEDAFAKVQQFQPAVLISDIGMPEQDGYALMQRIRALPPGRGGRLLSVALTAYARREDKAKAIAMGFTTHLAKPVRADELLATVANLAFFGS